MRSLVYLICSFWLSYVCAGRIGYSTHAQEITYEQRENGNVTTYPLDLFTTNIFIAYAAFRQNICLIVLLVDILNKYWLLENRDEEQREVFYQNLKELLGKRELETMSKLINLISESSDIQIPNIYEMPSFKTLVEPGKHDLDKFVEFFAANPNILERV